MTDSPELTFKIYRCQEFLSSEDVLGRGTSPCLCLSVCLSVSLSLSPNVLIPRPTAQRLQKAGSVSPGSTKHRESPRTKSSQFS